MSIDQPLGDSELQPKEPTLQEKLDALRELGMQIDADDSPNDELVAAFQDLAAEIAANVSKKSKATMLVDAYTSRVDI